MKHLSLFSGIGGFDLASQWMGWENMAHCEINPFCRTILNYYWPKAISYEDIKTTDFSVWRGIIDIVTGGFPCQPFSVAGARKGTEDDRHLWPEMLRAIREIQPRYIVGENVYGLFNWNEGLVFEQVCADMEAEGYEVQPVIIPACAVGAPHRRDRIWFVAYAGIERREEREQSRGRQNETKTGSGMVIRAQRFCNNGVASDSDGDGSGPYRFKEGGREESKDKSDANKWEWLRYELTGNDAAPDVTNTNGIRLRGESNGQRGSRFISKNNARDYWQNFPTQSPVCNGDDGIPSRLDFDSVFKGIKLRKQPTRSFGRWRNESIKAAGNAIVPQVAYQIFKAIEATL